MPWVGIEQSLPLHRKTQTLCEALKIKTPQAVGHLALLWLWALDNARPDGFLMGASPRTVARASGWTGDPVRFMDALCDAGFVDGSMTIHDWEDYTGRFTDQRTLRRSSNRDAQARRRERLRHQKVSMTDDDLSSDVITGQQSTVPESTGPTPPKSPPGVTPKRQRKAKTERELITDQDTEELVAKYAEQFGSGLAVREVIDDALNHVSRFKSLSERRYVDGWLRRELKQWPGFRVVNGRGQHESTHQVVDRTGVAN